MITNRRKKLKILLALKVLYELKKLHDRELEENEQDSEMEELEASKVEENELDESELDESELKESELEASEVDYDEVQAIIEVDYDAATRRKVREGDYHVQADGSEEGDPHAYVVEEYVLQENDREQIPLPGNKLEELLLEECEMEDNLLQEYETHDSKPELKENEMEKNLLKEFGLQDNVKRRRVTTRKPRFWVNPYFSQRDEHNVEIDLLKNLQWGSGNNLKNVMTVDQFEEILRIVDPVITKKNTVMRVSISSRVRLAITLRLIVNGDSYGHLEALSRVSYKTISSIVPEVLQAIWNELQPQIPRTTDEWIKISEEFVNIWQFPHTLGAVAAKHIRILANGCKNPKYFSHKGYFSILLFAIIDANGKFMFIDVGSKGRIYDRAIFQDSPFYEELINGTLNIPQPSQLPAQDGETSFVFVGDDTFETSHNLLRSFNQNLYLSQSESAFNDRINRVMMVTDYAFEKLAERFRIFHTPIKTSIKTTELIVKAACALHNFYSIDYSHIEYLPQEENQEEPFILDPVKTEYNDNTDELTAETRQNIIEYLQTEEMLEIQ